MREDNARASAPVRLCVHVSMCCYPPAIAPFPPSLVWLLHPQLPPLQHLGSQENTPGRRLALAFGTQHGSGWHGWLRLASCTGEASRAGSTETAFLLADASPSSYNAPLGKAEPSPESLSAFPGSRRVN